MRSDFILALPKPAKLPHEEWNEVRRLMIKAIPKPAKRGPKPKKRVRKVKKASRAKLAREADKLWAQIVKLEGFCEFHGNFSCANPYIWSNGPKDCKGPLQAMHGISRRYRGTRWLPINGFCGCAAVHLYYTHREGEWQSFLVKAWGLPVYEELWNKARAKANPDLPVIIASLKEELAR